MFLRRMTWELAWPALVGGEGGGVGVEVFRVCF